MTQPRILGNQINGITVGNTPTTSGDKLTSQSYVESAVTINVGQFISTDAELLQAQIHDQSQIMNTWVRFSHNSTATQPALPNEISSWTFDEQTGTLSSSLNSSSYIGFISPEGKTNYTHEATFSSTAGDDDTIALVIAYAVDANGMQHTLSACRSPGNNVNPKNSWCVVYDLSRSTQAMIKNGASLAPITEGGWAGTSPTRVRVVRNGDSIECTCSQFRSTTLDNTTKLTLSLTDDPRLSIFRGATSYGYGVLSQANSTWTDIFMSKEIYDMRTGKVWSNASGTFVVDPNQTIETNIGFNRLAYNPMTRKAFVITPVGSILPLALEGYLPTRSYTITVGAGVSQKLTLPADIGDCTLANVSMKVQNGTNWYDSSGVATLAYATNSINVINNDTVARTFKYKVMS